MGGAVLDEKRGYKAQKPLVSFVPPSAGMFVWLAVHLDSHKDFEKVKARGEDPNRVLLEKLFIELAEHKVSYCSKDILFTTRSLSLTFLAGPRRTRVLL